MVNHRHAVVRDLNSLGYHGDTPIAFDDLVSIILASPPGSAVKYAVDGGWPQTDQLLANLAEQNAGLTNLPHRYARPGIDVYAEPDPGPVQSDGSPRWTGQTREEFEARRARDVTRAASELESTERQVN